ncbi:lipopolysaccharide assembly protein LapB [Methylophaga sp. OBS4]|uniref:lipopolysaccharide assembly protein LapB n=1 Tax=Methylophaga sp. OBS4 TaxID=2991935 RepID=UPI002255F50B|nr:lipopolysaccharide assembly protein LapB [Methylophaga sp. OBS4]MCX4188573.1 lipopolysaccharide assembly protein LapB [Methylophaga sp. OBS4]
MMEWLFFLLPLAALSGWLLARKHYKRRYRPQDSPFSPEYFKGLNYLLNEQPDKAIDVFIGLLEVNSETVETHLALANLFRRRGETDRAIRIHQNLIARPSLSSQQRIQALVELGLDYMNAGVLDRAELLFLELLQQTPPPPEAAQQLVRIYQQEKNWHNAIKTAKQIPADKKTNTRALIAQFYCELAEPIADKDRHEALNMLRSAHHYDPDCVRASLLEGKILIKSGQHRKAIRVLQLIEQQNHFFLPEALPLLHTCYDRIGNTDAFKEWLQQLLVRHPHMTSARIMLTKIIQQQQGNQAAQQFLYRQLHQHPSVEGLHHLIILGEENHQVLIPLIKDVTTALIHKGDRYTCKNCGFSGRTLHWQCPGCSRWTTIRPIEIHLSALEKLLEPSR